MSSTSTSRILLIDDSSTNNLLFQSIFEEAGYKVSICFNGKEALRQIHKEIPDLVMLDVMMPGMDGFEVLNSIKTNSATSHIPVIMLTAKNDQESRERALSMGAIDYILKPIGINEILDVVSKVLQK
jgi:CheY-like chemotaxis protein